LKRNHSDYEVKTLARTSRIVRAARLAPRLRLPGIGRRSRLVLLLLLDLDLLLDDRRRGHGLIDAPSFQVRRVAVELLCMLKKLLRVAI